jgi:CubicO group peptidase (beta-lactamase class C family)
MAIATSTSLACDVRPEQVGLDPQRLARVDKYLDDFVAADHQKGSLIAIARRGKLAHVSMRGYRDAEAGLPVEADTLWRIYSMTKPITSVAAMMLYEGAHCR